MPADGNPTLTRLNHNLVIHVEGDDRGVPNRGQPNHASIAIVPTKVSFPKLLTRVEQRCSFTGQRIDTGVLRSLEFITLPVGKAEILKLGCATLRNRHDVVYRQGLA